MRLIIPNGLTAILATLQTAVQACHLHEQQAVLSRAFTARLGPTYEHLEQLLQQRLVLKREWDQLLAERRYQQADLSRLIRDAWIMLRRRDQRGRSDGGLCVLYRVPRLSPQHGSALLWLEHGRNLVHGEALACAAGHVPMAFPSVAELATALDLAARTEARFADLTLQLKDAEVALRKQQRLAAHLLRCLAARLRESQFDEPPTQTRALMRRFGFRFKATPSDDAVTRSEAAGVPEISAAPLHPQRQLAHEPEPESVAAVGQGTALTPAAAGPSADPHDRAAKPKGPLAQALDWTQRVFTRSPDPQASEPRPTPLRQHA